MMLILAVGMMKTLLAAVAKVESTAGLAAVDRLFPFAVRATPDVRPMMHMAVKFNQMPQSNAEGRFRHVPVLRMRDADVVVVFLRTSRCVEQYSYSKEGLSS